MPGHFNSRVFVVVTPLFLGLLAGCSIAPEGTEIHDPYEAVNRQVHDFNKDVDQAVLRPLSRGAAELPVELRQPIVNFSDNAALPGMVLNGLLQGDIAGLTQNTLRFVLNTTVGIGGLFDPAGAIGIAEQSTDFGETLAVWGVPEGAYVELPLLGPSTERDAFGQIVDFVIDPLERWGTREQLDYGTAAYVAEQVIDRGVFGDTVDSLLYESADSYAQARLFYLQNRRFELGDVAGETYVDAYIDPYEDLQ